MFEYVERVSAPLPPAAGGRLHARLDGIDINGCDQAALIDVLAAYERCIAQATARQQQVLARLDRLRGITKDDWTREEVAAALGVAPITARNRLSVSRIVYLRLRDTWRLLRDGRVTGMHARALAQAVEDLTLEQTEAVQEYVLRRVDLPVGEFTSRIRYAVAKYAPQAAEQASQDAWQDRTCWHDPGAGQTGTLVVQGPLDVTAAAWALLDDRAHRRARAGEDRSVPQRRFDAVADLILGENREQVAAVVEVTVPLDTLLGGDGPGELAGHGALSAGTARELALRPGARWRRLVTDPATGHLLACGAQSYPPDQLGTLLADPVEAPPMAEAGYRPSTRLARYVRARDRCCSFPGCRRQARRSELDHTVAWPHGATSPDNLHVLCPRHHRLKHQTGWTLAANPDGSTTWTSPTGRHYTTHPHDYNGP